MTYCEGWIRLVVLIVLLEFTLMGCAGVASNGSADLPVRQALIGKTRQELYACAGNPVSEKSYEGQSLVTYYKEASLLEESFPGSRSSVEMVHHGCRATIALRQDRVSEVRYDSVPSSYQDEDHCEEIFARCTGL